MSVAPVTRFAPSPSGELHLGNVRTALFNWLLARRDAGCFVLRIEDTDAARSRPEHVAQLLEDLRWLGLDWDHGPGAGGPAAPYEQSRRGSLYADALGRLEVAGQVFACYCTPLEIELGRKAQVAAGRPPRYAGTCRELTDGQRAAHQAAGRRPSLRFRVPAGRELAFDDLVHGPQRFRSDDIGDFVVRRADGSASFFFSNALDDGLMGVTHVLRGEDHLSNTPRQLLLLEALGLPAPRYGHLALLVGEGGAPLSKRDGALSVRELRAQGYLPAAILNLLFRLGHSSPLQGLLDPAALARGFDTGHLGRAPAKLDPVQLAGWQREAVQALAADEAAAWLAPAMPAGLDPSQRAEFTAAVRANVLLPRDAALWCDVVFGEPPPPDAAAQAILREAGAAFFAAAAAASEHHARDWPALVAAVKAATGRKGPALFKPLRCALTGLDHGPELAPLLRLMPDGKARERLSRYAH
ncbi:MAG: glutamate--tRNA ligase [Steroidobacteraceae bacterium]|nr:glutamate--tRNA ligase [Steroidobacteraceae bacterium]